MRSYFSGPERSAFHPLFPGPDLICEVNRTLKKANGSEVKIVVRSDNPLNPQQSMVVEVSRREHPDQDWNFVKGWFYCSNRLVPNWGALLVDDSFGSSRSEILKHISYDEMLALINMIGQPMDDLAKIRLQQEDESNQTTLDESPDSSPLPAL